MRFITTVPFTEARQQGEQMRAVRLRNEAQAFETEDRMRQSAEDQAVDAAIRKAVQPPPAAQPAPAAAPQMDEHALANMRAESAAMGMPGPREPATVATAAAPGPAATPAAVTPASPVRASDRIAQAVSRVPGGGRMALQLTQNAERRRDMDETNVMRYLSDPRTAHIGMEMAQRIGMQIPPQLAQNTMFWQGASIAKDLYEGDIAAAQRFTAAYAQSQQPDIPTRVNEAITAAGVPVRKKRYGVAQGDQGLVFYNVENPTEQITGPKRPGTVMTNEKGEVVVAPAGGGEVTPYTQGGQPLKAQKFGTTGRGGNSVYQTRYNLWLAAHPNDVNGALQYASGRRQLSPLEEQKIANQMAANEARQSMTPLGADWVQKRTLEIINAVRQPATPAPAANGTPTASVSPPQSAAVDTSSFPYEADFNGRSIFSQDGRTWVYEDGTPVQ